jgi:hypothetical protein
MKNHKKLFLVLTTAFILNLAQASDNCLEQRNLINEVSEKTNASIILEVTSILTSAGTNIELSSDNTDNLSVPKSVNNSSRLSEI